MSEGSWKVKDKEGELVIRNNRNSIGNSVGNVEKLKEKDKLKENH